MVNRVSVMVSDVRGIPVSVVSDVYTFTALLYRVTMDIREFYVFTRGGREPLAEKQDVLVKIQKIDIKIPLKND